MSIVAMKLGVQVSIKAPMKPLMDAVLAIELAGPVRKRKVQGEPCVLVFYCCGGF